MGWLGIVLCVVCFATIAHTVKVKVVMHSEEDSRVDEEEPSEMWVKRKHSTLLPFIKTSKRAEDKIEYEEDKPATEKPKQLHPNELIFSLIYKQSHINSMFKFGENWYTWSTEQRTDGSKVTNYYICYDEPKHCDEVGWERTDSLPKCAFQIDSLLPEDRACINPFGVEPHNNGACDGAEQMKVSEVVRACGPRIRSLWRFFRVARRPTNVAKPADVNSLICEDEEECYVTIEYRIHHDRITFSLHEPTRGQTFKSALKRDTTAEEAKQATTERTRSSHRARLHVKETPRTPKVRMRVRKTERKPAKERNDSGYVNRRAQNNKNKIPEDVSDDFSE